MQLELALKKTWRCALMALAGWSAAASGWAAEAAETAVPSAQMATCGKPEYPKESIAKAEEGTVVMKFLIGTDGTVRRSAIVTSSGYRALDVAAAEALQRCHFKPGIRNGEPAEAWAPVAYVWTLDTKSVTVPTLSAPPQALDPAQQAALYRDQALQGDTSAQVKLGLLYLSGRGVEKNDSEAAGWILKAAQHGYARAEMNLGLLYQSGRGVPRD